MGGSSSKSSSSSTTTNNQRQISLDAKDNEAVAIASGGNTSVTITDAGQTARALQAAQQVATASMNNSAGLARESIAAQSEALDRGFDFAKEFGAASYDFAQAVFTESLDTLKDDKQEQYQQQAELIGSIATAARSETSQALDKISTYFFLSVALLGGAYLLGGRK